MLAQLSNRDDFPECFVYGPAEREIELENETFSSCTLSFHFSGGILRIRNCDFSAGINISGYLEKIEIIDSKVNFLDSDIKCRQLSVLKSSHVEFINCHFLNLNYLVIKRNSSFVYDNPNEELVANKLLKVIDSSSLTLASSKARCLQFVAHKAEIDFNNLYNTSVFSGVSYNSVLCDSSVIVNFCGDTICTINNKAYRHQMDEKVNLQDIVTFWAETVEV